MTTISTILTAGAIAIAVTSATAPVAAETITKKACTIRNASAVMTSSYPADLPALAQVAQLSGQAAVRVDLDERGTARAATIVTSSGSSILDQAARESALGQKYTPEVRDCEAVSGAYQVTVEFTRNNR